MERYRAEDRGDSFVMYDFDVRPRECTSCGAKEAQAGLALVIISKLPGVPGPGRMRLACLDCRAKFSAADLQVTVPLDDVTDEVFLQQYVLGRTRSTPDTASRMVFGVVRHEVVTAAWEAMAALDAARSAPDRAVVDIVHFKAKRVALLQARAEAARELAHASRALLAAAVDLQRQVHEGNPDAASVDLAESSDRQVRALAMLAAELREAADEFEAGQGPACA